MIQREKSSRIKLDIRNSRKRNQQLTRQSKWI